MQDLLVRLYALPPLEPALGRVARHGVVVRRALPLEKPLVAGWVERHFATWRAETEAAFARLPVACFVATREGALAGFACYDAACPNFFGPSGVAEVDRGMGIGRALLLATLHAQRAQGYAYAIIGGAGPVAFYVESVGAIPIEGSDPGIYAGRVKG